MQFNQCGPFPQWNYGPFSGFIPPQQPCNPTPEVVGEGDVVSTVNLDGSMQFYFVPVLSYPCGFRSMTAPCANPCGAWLIKSISNPITAMNLHGPTSLRCPAMSIPQIQSKFIPDINANPGYQLKFHNDGCSSTSDLHYFYPNLRACEWIPPVPYIPPEPATPQFTCPEVCQERPNVEPPPCERMCVDPQTSKCKHESEKPISYPGVCFSTSEAKQDTGTTKQKRVRTSSSKSSCCSLRSLLNKIKCKRKKRNDNTKRNDSSKCRTNCCSHCECTRQTTKRKKEEKTNPSPSTSSGSFLNWSKRKKKEKDTEEINNDTSSNKKKDTDKPDPRTQLDTSQDSCQRKKEKEDKVEKSITPSENKEKKTRTSSSNKSVLQSLFDKIKSSVSSLYCTPSNCNQKKQTSAEPAKSSKSDENKKKKEATPKSSGMSLKGILAKVCYRCKKDKPPNGTTRDRLKRTRSVSSVHVLYDRGSKDLQKKSSHRSESFNPSPSSSRISPASPHHCGCDKCLRCICMQKALDCQCSKYEIIDKHNANHCTCHERQSAKDCKCDKVTEEDAMDICICKEGQSHQKSCECDKDTGKESKTLKIASKCSENQKKDCKCYKPSSENPCPCGCGRDKTLCENRCKSKSYLEKKRSNLKTSKLAQSANGDKKKRIRYVCGCDEDNKDETNCDDQCKNKSSLKEVIENKRQADCTCILCKSTKTANANRKSDTEKGNMNQNKFNCGCDRDSDKMECDSNCKNKSKKVSLGQQLADDLTEDMILEPDDPPIRGSEKIINKEENTNSSKNVCAKDLDKKACDNKRRNKVTLRLALSESEAEDSIMVIEPSDSRLLWDSESFLLTSDSSEYCSCRPGHCKYKGNPGDSACSCDSEVE